MYTSCNGGGREGSAHMPWRGEEGKRDGGGRCWGRRPREERSAHAHSCSSSPGGSTQQLFIGMVLFAGSKQGSSKPSHSTNSHSPDTAPAWAQFQKAWCRREVCVKVILSSLQAGRKRQPRQGSRHGETEKSPQVINCLQRGESESPPCHSRRHCL